MSRNNVTPRLSKRKKKQAQINAKTEEDIQKINFHLRQVQPLSSAQEDTWEAFFLKKNLLLHGVAGTGKSFISLFLAVRELFEDDVYKKVIIIRSVVPTRAVGFLPGKLTEKIEVYEEPYQQIFTELFERSDAYDYLKDKGVVEFISTSFIRGITLNDCIVVVDEIQNMDWGELSSVITRAGTNCKMIFCGDIRQSDFRLREQVNRDDIIDFIQVLKKMNEFTFIEFGVNDIVRGPLVKSFIINSIELGRDIVT